MLLGPPDRFLYKQQRLEEARSETLHATNIYEKTGATSYIERCRILLQQIEEAMSNGKSPGTVYLSILYPYSLSIFSLRC